MRQNISEKMWHNDEREMYEQEEDRDSFISWQLDVKILGIDLKKTKMVSKPTLGGVTLEKG